MAENYRKPKVPILVDCKLLKKRNSTIEFEEFLLKNKLALLVLNVLMGIIWLYYGLKR